MITPAELENFSAQVGEHLFGHYLPFWCGPALDLENGGWMAWLSNDLKPDRSQPKGLIVNSRILWAFSAVHRVRPEPVYFDMAARAFDFVMNKFWDPQHGGAFCIPAALERAKGLFELVERHAHDAQFGGYVEVCHRDWSEAGADARLSEKDMNEKKSMNNHLHVLEAWTNLFRAWPEPRVAQRLRELIEIFLTRILDARTNHLHHFFT